MWRAVVLVLALASAADARTLPERPAAGEKPDFHLLAGGGWLAFDLDVHGAEGAPDLDHQGWGGAAGVGWTWAEFLRLEAQLGAWPLTGDAACVRFTCGALVSVGAGLSAVGSLGVTTVVLDLEAAEDQTLEGFEAGAGAAWTAGIFAGVSLEARYLYLRQRYFEKDVNSVTLHPDATAHLLSVGLILDL